MNEQFVILQKAEKPKTSATEDADGVLTRFGMEVAQQYAQQWRTTQTRNTELEQRHPELVGLFYDIRNDSELAAEHALPFEDTEPTAKSLRFVLPMGEPLEKAQQIIAFGKRGGKIVGYKGGKPVYASTEKPTKPKTLPAGSPKLPENPWRYFNKKEEAFLVPLNALRPVRAREQGIQNAGQYMRQAYEGKSAKRDPISLMDHGDGTYSILSGNSTFAQAKQNGWKTIPAMVDEKLTAAVHKVQAVMDTGKFIDDDNREQEVNPEALKWLREKSTSDLVTEAKALAKRHSKTLEKSKSVLAEMAPEGSRIEGRVKDLDSIVGKIGRKPNDYQSASELLDISGMRVISPTIQDVYTARDKIAERFEVLEQDDRITRPQGPMHYRSIHMMVRDEDGLIKEIQLRTATMHSVNEFWLHDVYKPQTNEQRALKAEKQGELYGYAAEVSDHVFSRDRGDKPPDPPNPGCPQWIKPVFGCPEI